MSHTRDPVVVVSIPGAEFAADKQVLSAASPFIKEVLSDVTEGQRLKLELQGVTPAAFEALRGYIQMGTVKLTCQNVTDVYRCAYKLQIRGMIIRCLQYLAEAGTVGRHLVLYANAADLGLRDDQKAAFEFLVDHFDATIRSRGFLELPWEAVVALLRSDHLATANEVSVFIAALAWLQHDYAARRTREDAVLGCVRFGLLSEDMLLKCLEPPTAQSAMENRFIRARIIESAFYHYARLRGRAYLAKEFKPHPRVFSGAMEPPITWSLNGKVENFEAGSYSRAYQRRRVEVAQRIHSAIRRRKSVQVGSPTTTSDDATSLRRYYEAHEQQVVAAQAAVRSYLARKHYATLHAQVQPPALLEDMAEEEFPTRHRVAQTSPTATWSSFPAQRLPRHTGPLSDPDCAMVLLSGGIEPARSHEMGTGCALVHFDPRTGAMTRCGRLPQPRHNHATAILDGYLYVLGGFDTRNTHRGLKFATSSCFRMKLASRKWERIADMRYARCNHVALAHAGRIYTVAGQDEFDTFLGSVEEYAPDANTWREMGPPLACRISAPGAAVTAGTLVVAGGIVQSHRRSDRVFVSSAVHCWDHKLARWVPGLAPLPTGRGSFSLVEHRGNLHAIGGLIRASDGASLDVVPDVLVYRRDSWENGTPLPRPLHGSQALQLPQGRLLLFGGLCTATLAAPTDTIWSSDGSTWMEVGKLPAPLAGMAVALVPVTANPGYQ